MSDLLWVIPIIVAGLSLTAVPAFAFALARKLLVATAILVLLVVCTVLQAFYGALTFGGPGILVCLSTFLIIPLSALLWIGGWPFLHRSIGGDYLRHILYLGGGLFIIGLQIATPIGVLLIGDYCDQQTMRIGDQIVPGLEGYKQDIGDYPQELDALVPGYLSEVPVATCLGRLGGEITFSLERCSRDEVLLTASSFGGPRILRYNLLTGNWSSISFLDGVCNFLR